MASGACVIVYDGKKGRVFYIKYRDAAGVQVKERLGREADGWTQKKAERQLGVRLDKVESEGYRKPDKVKFAAHADKVLTEYLPGLNRKPSTMRWYRSTIEEHLKPFFGTYSLTEIEARPELLDKFISQKTQEGLSPKTILNLLSGLSVILKRAVAWRLIRVNPVAGMDRPDYDPPEMTIIRDDQIARLETAFRELEAAAEPEEVKWWRLTRRITFFALGSAFRRGEILGLRWQYVQLLTGLVTVEWTWTGGEFVRPKSKKSRRTIELGPRTVEVLNEQWRESSFHADEDIVFGHPTIGKPLDPKVIYPYINAALKRAKIPAGFQPLHGMRHTNLTHEAKAGNSRLYVQAKAGHSSAAMTDRYTHAAQVLFPGAAAKGEAELFGDPEQTPERVLDIAVDEK